jgi:hypothetical protein
VRPNQLAAHIRTLAMRKPLVVLNALLLSTAAAQGKIDTFSPFVPPFLEDTFDLDNTTLPELELLKRASSGCPSNYNSCSYLNANGACCKNNAVCSMDNNGNVGCCPQGSVCTGVLGGTVSGGGATFATAGTTTAGFIQTTTTTAGGAAATIGTATSSGLLFVGATGGSNTQSSGASSRSYVPNPYYPAFPYIPTTYQNAAACSSAYTTCQTNVASCTSYLGGAAGAHGVTVSAPNGGVTVAGPTTTYGSSFASAVCSTLSSMACYGLVVEACGNFGTGGGGGSQGAGARCTGGLRYGAGVGVAVGLAGQVMGYR